MENKYNVLVELYKKKDFNTVIQECNEIIAKDGNIQYNIYKNESEIKDIMSILQKKFYDGSGNFDNRKVIELLKKAQKEQLKSEFGPSKTKKQGKAFFLRAGQKDVWQFINKLSIFINSGIDVKGAL